MKTIAISRAYSPVEVDLWGAKFETVDLSRSAEIKAEEIRSALALSSGIQAEIDKLAELMDVRLRPLGGVKKKPSTLIKAKWKANELTRRQLYSFLDEVGLADDAAQEEGDLG